MIESHIHSWLKAFSWRFIGTAISWVATYYVTKSVEISTSVSILELASKTFLFYLHERLWIRIGSFSALLNRQKIFKT